jgi:hypothetical protein
MTMRMPPGQEPGHRRAALRLYGLHPFDREWLLMRLAPATRKVLKKLLAELRRLGIDRSCAMDDLLPACATGDFALAASDVEAVDNAGADRMHVFLGQQNEHVRAMVLYAHRWRWSRASWGALREDERYRAQQLMQGFPAIQPAVFSALIEAVAIRMRETAGAAAAPEPAVTAQ